MSSANDERHPLPLETGNSSIYVDDFSSSWDRIIADVILQRNSKHIFLYCPENVFDLELPYAHKASIGWC